MKLNKKIVKKGEWERYRKTIEKISVSAFPRKERTPIWIFRDIIDKCYNITIIYYYGRIPVGFTMSSKLEQSIDNRQFKRFDHHFKEEDTLYIYNVAVHKNYQKCGIGPRMLNDVINIARQRRFKRITLHSKNPNMRRLAFRYGFRIIKYGISDGFKMGYMAKCLTKKNIKR